MRDKKQNDSPDVARLFSVGRRLALGSEDLFYNPATGQFSSGEVAGSLPLRYPRIGIYVGRGASHSWTWFVDTIERLGLYDVRFLDENDVCSDGLDQLDAFLVGGGDCFALGESWGEAGALHLHEFLARGGLYIGVCAGAYLMFSSNQPALSRFNFTDCRIGNLARTLPEPKRMQYKFCLSYGCEYVYQPVRGPVLVRFLDHGPFRGTRSIVAPIYGGAMMLPEGETESLACFDGFTEGTMFLVDREFATETMLGKSAAVHKRHGRGHVFLFSPHFEHPDYPVANALLCETIYFGICDAVHNNASADEEVFVDTDRVTPLDPYLRGIRRELSSARIVALGIENQVSFWKIGGKMWEPEKIRMFLECVWRRLKALSGSSGQSCVWEEIQGLASTSRQAVLEVKEVLDRGGEAEGEAERMFETLKKLAAAFLGEYFRLIEQRNFISVPNSDRSARV